MTVDEIVVRDLKYTGVTNWHNAGFKGQGVIVLNCESNTGHGATTRRFIEIVAPECKVISGDFSLWTQNDKLMSATINYENNIYNFFDFVVDNKVKIVTVSEIGSEYLVEEWHQILLRLKNEYGVIFLCAAGNEGDDSDHENVFTRFSFDTSMVIGACSLATGKPVRCGYSGVGSELDFSNTIMWWAGTSASTPFTAGEVALIIGRYGDLSYEEVYAYLKHYSMDLGDVGDDNYYGWGMPIMPDTTKKYITLTIGSNDMYVDGVKEVLDTMPIIDKFGRTLVPIRKPMEALGHTVEWLNDERKVVIYE